MQHVCLHVQRVVDRRRQGFWIDRSILQAQVREGEEETSCVQHVCLHMQHVVDRRRQGFWSDRRILQAQVREGEEETSRVQTHMSAHVCLHVWHFAGLSALARFKLRCKVISRS